MIKNNKKQLSEFWGLIYVVDCSWEKLWADD